ncbi:spore coat protein [Achromobacter sp. MYb9]|nr:spore coat protein [Achromobacter sp. MYb9]
MKNYFTSVFCSKRNLGKFSKLKVALVSDALTQASLEAECTVRNITPENCERVFLDWRPDVLFVESAWQGFRNSWKYGIASYPDHPERTNLQLRRMLDAAQRAGIPAVFWNKEDSVHYSRFIGSARLFRYIYTVDENCIEQYRADSPGALVIGTLPFPIQPRFHHPEVKARQDSGYSCFIGSYGTHVHPRRRQWQDSLFEVFSAKGLDVYDRNSGRKSLHYRYPSLPGLTVRPRVSYEKTASLYKSYKFNLNVNTVEASPTMYSRRLIEILAVGGVAITTPSLAASELFSEYCHIVSSRRDMEDVIRWSASQYRIAQERARHGAQMVRENHTWAHRLQTLEDSSIF